VILRAISKRERTATKLRQWLAESEEEQILRYHADLIMIHQNDLSRRMREAVLQDPRTGKNIVVPLNPRLNPVENAQVLYEKAKRLRRGRPVVSKRLTQVEKELKRLKTGLEALDRGEGIDEQLLTLIPSPRVRRASSSPTAPRHVVLHGYTVQVGKDAAQNDALLRSASPEDLWLHAKGVPGSHVIVRHRGEDSFPPEVILAAARLAARYSQAKGERWVEISYTPVKYVHKPKGAPPGLVIIDQEDTLTISPVAQEGK